MKNKDKRKVIKRKNKHNHIWKYVDSRSFVEYTPSTYVRRTAIERCECGEYREILLFEGIEN